MVQCGVMTKSGKPCKLPKSCMVHKTKGGMNGKDEAKDMGGPDPKDILVQAMMEKIDEVESKIADREETLEKIKIASKSKLKLDQLSVLDDFQPMVNLGKEVGKSFMIGYIKGEIEKLEKQKKELYQILENIKKVSQGKLIRGGATPMETEQARRFLKEFTQKVYRETGDALHGFQTIGISEEDEEEILAFISYMTDSIPSIYYSLDDPMGLKIKRRGGGMKVVRGGAQPVLSDNQYEQLLIRYENILQPLRQQWMQGMNTQDYPDVLANIPLQRFREGQPNFTFQQLRRWYADKVSLFNQAYNLNIPELTVETIPEEEDDDMDEEDDDSEMEGGKIKKIKKTTKKKVFEDFLNRHIIRKSAEIIRFENAVKRLSETDGDKEKYKAELENALAQSRNELQELNKIFMDLKAVKGAGLGSLIKRAGKFIKRRVIPLIAFGPRGNRPTGRFKDYLEKEGNKQIATVDYGRVPLSKGVKTAMNILSTGKFSKKQQELGYEDIYHDFIIITYKDGSKRLFEKNHIVEEKPVSDEAIKNIKVSIPVKKDLTLNQMITNASYEDNEFWKYSANKKNCQDFARRIVDKNALLPQIDTYKILEKQKAQDLVDTIPAPLKGIPLLATNLANALDRVVYGDGVGSKVIVVGDRKNDKQDLIKARLMINQII